jgi:hypothetical protein
MASERQIAANRANAAKSTGPRHTLLAHAIVLDGESIERFTLFISSLHKEFQPANFVESALIESMAVARWRQMRLWALEKANLNHEMHSDTTNPPSSNLDDVTKTALAYRNLSEKSRSMEIMHRYEARLDRQYNRALDRLIKVKEKKEKIASKDQFSPILSTT